MDARRPAISPTDVVTDGTNAVTGVAMLTLQFFPFAIPALVLVVAPVALLAGAALLVASPVLLPLWLLARARR